MKRSPQEIEQLQNLIEKGYDVHFEGKVRITRNDQPVAEYKKFNMMVKRMLSSLKTVIE